MKKIILSLSVAFLMTGLNAQKAEMDATNSAFKSKDYARALEQAEQAEAKLSDNHTIKPEDLTMFYFNAGQAAKASGNMMLAAQYYSKLGEIESSNYWKAKNKVTKKWEYFFDQAEAKRITSAGNYSKLKSAELSESLLAEAAPQINKDANAALQSANVSFKAKNYQDAGEEFLKSYYLYKAVGKDNDLLKYYAALSFLQTEDKTDAANMLQELVDNNFTGVITNYLAIDKATGEQVGFANKDDMDTQVKLGLVTDPKVETTESLEEELYSNTTYAWYSLEDWDKALLIGQKGLEKYPSNENMNQIVSGVYYKTGNADKFIQNLREKVDNGSASAEDYFNLAKSLEDTNGDIEEAKSYYKKAIELDPNFGNAYLNLAFAIIKPEQQYVEVMNQNLGSTAKEKKAYKDNSEKRKMLYVEAVPYLERAYELNQDNIQLIRILETSYDVLGDDDNYFKFKKLYEEHSKK